MRRIDIENLEDSRVADFASLTDRQLRSGIDPSKARIIVESPKVIKVAIESGLYPMAILCEEKHICGDAKEIIGMCGDDTPLYTASRSLLQTLTGYVLTRGVLASVKRPKDKTAAEVVKGARRICILDGVCDSTNIGAIFRSAAALGVDGIALTHSCCDPLCRRAIRVSMGSVFLLPWCWIDNVDEIKDFGFKTLAMALRNDSISLDDPILEREPRLAIVMGTEGDGLSDSTIGNSDYVVKIPMAHNVDSLNVAAASAVAFWELAGKQHVK